MDEPTGPPPETERLAALEARVARVEARLSGERVPRTMILDDNFLKRAFAIWGHYFVSNLIIGLALLFLVGTFVVLLLALGVLSRW